MNATQVSRKLKDAGFERRGHSKGYRKGYSASAGGFEVKNHYEGGISVSVKPLFSTTFEAVCEAVEAMGFVKVEESGRRARFELS